MIGCSKRKLNRLLLQKGRSVSSQGNRACVAHVRFGAQPLFQPKQTVTQRIDEIFQLGKRPLPMTGERLLAGKELDTASMKDKAAGRHHLG
jgi:hypothetical protein